MRAIERAILKAFWLEHRQTSAAPMRIRLMSDLRPVRTDADHAVVLVEMDRLWGAVAGTPECERQERALPVPISRLRFPGENAPHRFPCPTVAPIILPRLMPSARRPVRNTGYVMPVGSGWIDQG